MTVSELINGGSEIFCACAGKFLPSLVKEQILLIRADGTVEITVPDDLDNEYPPLMAHIPGKRVIGVTAFAEGTFVTVHADERLCVFTVDESKRTISLTVQWDPMDECKSNPPGVTESDFESSLLSFGTSLVFRYSRTVSDMALDSRSRKVFSPLVMVDRSGRRTVFDDTLVVDCSVSGESLACLCRDASHSYSVKFFRSDPSPLGACSLQPVESVVLLGNSLSSLGEPLVGIRATGNGTLCVAGSSGVVFLSNGKLGPVIRYPSMNVLARPRSPAVRKSGSPKMHPALNSVRKHSEVRIAPFLEESLLNLSLSGSVPLLAPANKEWTLPLADTSALHVAVGGKAIFFIAHGSFLKLPLSSLVFETLSTEITDDVNSILVTEEDTPVLVGSRMVRNFFPDGRKFSHPGPGLSIAALNPVLASLHANELQFHYLHSVQTALEFQFGNFAFLNLFEFPGGEILVSTVDETHVVAISQSSPMTVASMDSASDNSPSHVVCDVSDVWTKKGLKTDVFTLGIGIFPNQVFWQITQHAVFMRGSCVYQCSHNDTMVSHSAIVGSVLMLTASGLVLHVDETGDLKNQISTKISDPTVIHALDAGKWYIGSFDGELFHWNDWQCAQHLSLSEAAVESIATTRLGDVIVTCRSGDVIVFDHSLVEKKRFQLNALKVVVTELCVVFFGIDLFVLNLETLELRSVELGHFGALNALSVQPMNDTAVSVVAIVAESQRLVKFFIDTKTSVATYVKALPFSATKMVTAAEPAAVDMYLIGTLERINRAALLILVLGKARIGLVGINDAVSVSGVLPFNEVREEPISIALWAQEMFPDGGLLAVGTSGHMRGRLILFERSSMHAIAKTSVPSPVVSAICELSSTVLVIGCEDCVALVGLKPGPRTMPVVLSTIASFSTYSQVNHLTRVDDSRFLCATDNGLVQLMRVDNDTVLVEATMEAWIRVKSPCVFVPATQSFICSTEDGEMMTCTLDDSANGLIRIVKRERIGASITAACVDRGTLVVTTSTGGILQVSPETVNRLTNQSA